MCFSDHGGYVWRGVKYILENNIRTQTLNIRRYKIRFVARLRLYTVILRNGLFGVIYLTPGFLGFLA
jgi:hypothetical protein